MPYIEGKRVSQEEFIRLNSSTQRLYTGPNGDNPAPAPELDEDRKPVQKGKSSKPGNKRSKQSAKSASNAIADALGVSTESLPEVPDLKDSDVEASNDPE